MTKFRISSKRVVAGALALAFGLVSILVPYGLASAFSFVLSPMTQKIVLNPGDTFSSSFRVSNPGTETSTIRYEVSLEKYYVDEKYDTVFEDVSDRGSIAEWTTIDSPTTGTIEPNDGIAVSYTVKVPSNAPAGGQYMAFKVKAYDANEKQEDNTDDEKSKNNSGDVEAGLRNEYIMLHTVYAEITGNSIRQGEIFDLQMASFLLSGNIKGSASVKNTGNVHGTAKYTLQVFPLFSNEEIYTNEEEPTEWTVLPDRTRTEVVEWDKTPAIGIFNVVFTVSFDGVTEPARVSKLIIKCPVWLLFVIFFAIASLIIWIVLKVRARGKATAE